MKVVLAEKPSVARDIAQYLRANRRHEGYLEGNGWAITWAFGHMVELCEPEAYDPKLKAWRLDTLPILPPAFKLRPRADASALQQLQVIQTLFRQAEEIKGRADGEAASIYSNAYNRSSSARSLYSFMKSMETFEMTFDEKTHVILSTDSELYKYLKSSR